MKVPQLLVKGIPLSRILYHGTTQGYHDVTLQAIGRYEVSPEVCLSGVGFQTPVGYAFTRAKFYSDQPVLLVVKTELTQEGFRRKEGHSNIIFDYLLAHSYAQISLIENDPRLEDTVNKIQTDPRAKARGVTRLLTLARVWILRLGICLSIHSGLKPEAFL